MAESNSPEGPSAKRTKNDTITLDDGDSDSEIDVSSLPSGAECQALTEKFAEVTGTNTALAQFFLQDRKWNLEVSIEDYYQTQKEKSAGEGTIQKHINFSKTFQSMVKTASITTEAPKKFKLLTWNIDGLDKVNLKRRTKAIMKIIDTELVDIIFLQEAVPQVYKYMEERFPQYMFIAAGEEEYFVAILLLRTTVRFDDHQLVEYASTVMGRNLLIVNAHIGDCKMRLLTSHLESTAEFSVARQKQLRTAFQHLTEAPANVNSILGGDLNLRDKEVTAVGIPLGVVDVWEHTGSRQSAKYTWNLAVNTNKQVQGKYSPKCRFDRVYMRSGRGSGAAKAVHFGFVGIEKVPNTQSFPSDHWGVLTHYEITS